MKNFSGSVISDCLTAVDKVSSSDDKARAGANGNPGNAAIFAPASPNAEDDLTKTRLIARTAEEKAVLGALTKVALWFSFQRGTFTGPEVANMLLGAWHSYEGSKVVEVGKALAGGK